MVRESKPQSSLVCHLAHSSCLWFILSHRRLLTGSIICSSYGLAFEKCQLGDEVRRKEGKLCSPVSENSENWNMGQRQWVCLDRVLLKKSKTIFITIAHRITSVIGRLIEEYDSPSKLLEDKSTSFAQLVAEYTMRSKTSFEKSSYH
ncbi:ABC transporter C family member [Arachis hypogaea]|nr:ABC transporter C family member [Arachis hypogaea]